MRDSFRLLHLSDLHFGLEDRAALAWVAQEIARDPPAGVAITGDLTMRARHREFAAAARWIDQALAGITRNRSAKPGRFLLTAIRMLVSSR